METPGLKKNYSKIKWFSIEINLKQSLEKKTRLPNPNRISFHITFDLYFQEDHQKNIINTILSISYLFSIRFAEIHYYQH